MDNMTYILLALLFACVFGLAMLALRWLGPNSAHDRLETLGSAAATSARPNSALAPAGTRGDKLLSQVARLSGGLARFSLPKEGWEKSNLRQRFMHAGLRGENVAALYFSAKTGLALLFPGLLWLVMLLTAEPENGSVTLMLLLAASTFGLYLPGLVLSRMIKTRKREIVEHFPDALDLLTVCVEAGQSIDAAIAKVAEEMALSAKVLSEEFYLLTLELRAGSGRQTALRYLALRTGLEEVESLVSMLLQADRFGTSVGSALRVHAEGMRTRRRQRAEESAAKVALKLLFPLIFCIFPALILVLMGPAIIMAYRMFKPAAGM